ncbi:MAG: hypothetical protein GX200_10380 [Firmicutes bacterium]|nr:hypothetical protein [Bacillota bacterium]
MLILLLLRPCHAAAKGKVVIVNLARLQVDELVGNEELLAWLKRGTVGLLNTQTAGGTLARSIYTTLGAGSRATATDNGRLAFMRQEEANGNVAEELYLRHQGNPPRGEIIHLGMADIIRANQKLQHPVRPGLLGDVLHAAGKRTALIGNADGKQPNREAALFVADSSGQIDYGDVSSSVLGEDESFPYGCRLHAEQVWRLFREVYPQADLIVIDWGDTVRLDEYRPLLADTVAEKVQKEILQDVSRFLSQVYESLYRDDLLILLAAVPKSGTAGADTLGLAAVYGDGFPPGKLLTSATTRRDGLAAITDIAPLVLERIGAGVPPGTIGRPLSAGKSGTVETLLALRDGIDNVYRLRPPLLKTYVFLQIIFVLGALLNLFVRIFPVRRFAGLLLSLLVVPLVLLYLPLHRLPSAAGFAAAFVATVVCTLVLMRFLADVTRRLAAVALITALSLAVDTLQGAPLMKVSVLGYDPVSGARYYGLGNEYMGVLVGMAVLGGCALLTLLPEQRRLLLGVQALIFVLLVFILVAPAGGANFGGTLTAMAAFAVTVAALLQWKPGLRSLLVLLAALFVFCLAAVLLNILVPQNAQSHLGRTLALLKTNGWKELQDIIVRKGSMNLKLFRYSQWSRVLLAFLGMLAVLFYRPRGMLQELHRRYPDLAAGFLGIITGSITALLTNDSGVVAAATTLLAAGVPLIMLAAELAAEKEFHK